MSTLLHWLLGYEYVLLVGHHGEFTIARVRSSRQGPSVRRYGNLVLLKPDGSTEGLSYVKTWLPWLCPTLEKFLAE